MRNSVLILSLYIIFTSCTKPSSSPQEGLVDLSQRNALKLKIDDYFEIDQIIKLETLDSALISNIAKVYLDGEDLFIFDNASHEVFHFDTNGNFKNKISSLGEAPGQYRAITDIEYDYNSKSIFVFDGAWTNKMLKFNLDGDLVHEKRLGFGAKSFMKIGVNRYVFYAGNVSINETLNSDNTFDNVIFTDSTFKMTSSTFPVDLKWDGYGFYSGSMNTFFVKTKDDSILFVPQLPNNMTVFNIDPDLENVKEDKHYYFENNNEFLPFISDIQRENVPELFDLLINSEFRYNSYSYTRNECLTYFSFSQSGPHYRVIIDEFDDMNYYISNEMNDLKHGRFHPYPIHNSSGEALVVNVLEPNDIHSNDYLLGRELKEEVDIDDNPVLVFYRLRSCK